MPEVRTKKTKRMKEVEEKIGELLVPYFKREKFEKDKSSIDMAEDLGVHDSTVYSWYRKILPEYVEREHRKKGWAKDPENIKKYLDPIVEEIYEKSDRLPSSAEIEKRDSGLAEQLSKRYGGIFGAYKKLNYLPSSEEVLPKLPKEIQKKFDRLSQDNQKQFLYLFDRYSDFALGNKKGLRNFISANGINKSSCELFFETNTQILARESAKKFLQLYNELDSETGKEYKWKKEYKIRNFLESFNPKTKLFGEFGESEYSTFKNRLARREGYWKEKYLKGLTKSLRENIKAIENDEKLCEEAAKKFINLYNELDPETGEEYKFEKKYGITTFLRRFNIKNQKIENEDCYGSYLSLYNHLKNSKNKHEDLKRTKDIFLKKLPEELRRGVKYIVSNKKLAQEAAMKFVNLYDEIDSDEGIEYKFTKKYRISKFFRRFDPHDNEFKDSCSFYNRLKYALRKENQDLTWKETLYSKLPEELEKKVKNILSGKKLIQDSAKSFIRFNEEKEKNVSLSSFLTRLDVNSWELLPVNNNGDYGFLFARLKKETGENSNWRNEYLDKCTSEQREKIKALDSSLAKADIGFDPLESTANFENFIEDEEGIKEIIKFFGGNEVDVADILAVKYPGLGSRDEFLDMLSNDVLSDYLRPINGNFDSMMDLVETGSRVLPFEENEFVRDMVIRKAKKYLMDDLGPLPDEDEIDEKIERLGSVIDEEDFYEG